MLTNYLKIILRSLWSNKLYSFINIAGLSVALAVMLIITQYLSYELSFENFHEKSDRIFRVTVHYKTNNGYDQHFARTNMNWINNLPEDFEEVENLIRFQDYEPRNVKVKEEKFRIEHAYTTDADVFNVFSFNLLKGNPETALQNPYSVVLTENTARIFFGNREPLGKEIFILNNRDSMEQYVVTGIMEDLPSNTHLPVNMLTSFRNEEERTGWSYTYFLLNQRQDINRLQRQLPAFIKKYAGEQQAQTTTLPVQPIKDIHLNSELAREIVPNGRKSSLLLFGGVGIFVLIMAIINFINLNTAQSIKKAREMGIRRVLGSAKYELKAYFIIQALVITLIAAFLAVILIYSFIIKIQELVIFDISYINIIMISVAAAILIGAVSGYFPAVILTRMEPLHALKSKGNAKHENIGIKNFLVAVQLIVCIILLSSALITRAQFEYIVNKNLGIKKEQVLVINSIPATVKNTYNILKNKLQQFPAVEGVSASMEVPSREIRDSGIIYAEGLHEDPATAPAMDIQVVDNNFIEVMDAKLVAGRSFKPRSGFFSYDKAVENLGGYLSNNDQEYILNEMAVKTAGWKNPEDAIGKTFSWRIGNLQLKKGTVVGVIKDYHQETFRNKIDPIVMINEPVWFNNILVRINADDMTATIGQLESVWNSMYPEYPMDYSFLDDLYNNLYKKEQYQLRLIYIFTGLAIMIAFLGILGLITYMLHMRVKEIAIRRILGASLSSITFLLSRHFIKLSLIGMIIAIPLTWYAMDQWLSNFVYRTTIQPAIFIVATGMIILVLLISILLQVFHANKENPADTLRID